MNDKKIKKINWLYLIGYIFGPMLICALCFGLSAAFFPKGSMAVILIMGPSLLSVIWWIIGGKIIFNQKKKKFAKELDADGFVRNQTFSGKGTEVIVDAKNGKIALLFFWNPFASYVVSAKRVEKAWVDDGRSGSGILEGSSCVSFIFTIDGIKIKVYTFTSNQRWKMNSNYILTGVSKADMMVKVIEEAKSKAK